MRKILLIILLVSTALLLPGRKAGAQDNPYEIDNTCYTYFQRAEALVGKDGFRAANDLLLKNALATGDTKAETLYYVEELKNIIRTSRNSGAAGDQAVEAAYRKLKTVAREKGYPQYYYYAYQLAQNYFYSHGQFNKTLALTQEMLNTALEEKDEYGLWTSEKYLASLYIDQSDFVSAKPHILNALRLFDTSTDETVRRQSPTRLYCDLADTYPIGTDSVHINVEKAREASKQHFDSLRVHYYLARLDALDGDFDSYREHRDYCLRDARFLQLRSYGDRFFSLMDSCIDGSILNRKEEIFTIPAIREIKVIANFCERLGYKEFAFEVEKGLVNRFEKAISRVNQSKLSELDVTMGKAVLDAELTDTKEMVSKIMHFLLLILTVLFAAIAFTMWMHIRTLHKHEEQDRRRIEELKEANEKVRLADAAKTRFVQNMSHEVRTPLNAIVGFSQLLSLPDGSLSPEEKDEFASHIINNTKMLTMLLDDILNASDMDKGNYSINYEEGEKDFMAQAAISSSEHRLQPGVQLRYVPEDPQPFTFTTDPRRVQQILINLITNACKHTSEGEIVVGSSLSEKPGYLAYSVTDTGPGIPPEQAEVIFERFTKLNEFVQGTGLGLSICRDIASRMGAEVYLDTTYTGGSRFVFLVPVNPTKN